MQPHETSIADYLSGLEPELLTNEHFSWWAIAVFDFCEELGVDDDPDLPEMQQQLRDYYSRRESEAEVRQMRETIWQMRGDGFLKDDSLLGIKYRCLYSIASPVEEIEESRTRYIASLVEAFRTVGLRMGGEQAVVERIKRRTGSLRALLADEDGAETYVWIDEYPLHDAAFRGDLEKVRHCLDIGIPVDTINRLGATALFSAAMEDRIEVARYLIDHGADVNAVASRRPRITYGSTPLQIATHSASPEMVRLLLEHGSDPSVLSQRGITPLESIVRRQNFANLMAVIYGHTSPSPNSDDEQKIAMLHQYQRAPRLADFRFTLRQSDTAIVIARLKTDTLANYDFRCHNLSTAWLAGEDLRGANLRNCDLRFAQLSKSDLRGADLSGADLTSAGLDGANFSGANLRGAKLSGAYMRSTIFDGADMTDAKVDNAAMHEMSIRGTRFLVHGLEHQYHTQYGPHRHMPFLADVTFTEATIAPPGFSLSDNGARLVDAADTVSWDRPQFAIRNNVDAKVLLVMDTDKLAGYDFRGIRLHYAWLPGRDLRGCNFQGCDMSNAVLRDADLTGANLSNVNLMNANLAGANLTGANLRKTMLAADMEGAVFDQADMTDATVAIARLYKASLRGTRFLVQGLEHQFESDTGEYAGKPALTDAVFDANTVVTPGYSLTDYGARCESDTPSAKRK